MSTHRYFGPLKSRPWTYQTIETELGKLPRYGQPHKSVEFKRNWAIVIR